MSQADRASQQNHERSIIRTALAAAGVYWLLESAVDVYVRPDTIGFTDGLLPSDPHEWWSRTSVLVVLGVTTALALRLTRRWVRARREADAVLASTTDAYIDLDQDWRIRQLNPQAESLLVTSMDEIAGKVFWDAFPEAASHFYLPLKRSMRSQKGVVAKGEYPPLDRFMEVHTAPRPDGISFYFRDQTQIREHERELQENNVRLQAILDSTVDGIISINEFGIIETYNRAAQDIFGYGPTEVLGKNIAMLMPPDVGAQHDGYISSYLRTGVSRIIDVGPREVTARRKDGCEFPMDLAIGQMRLDDQVYFVGIVRDISERKRSEIELRRSRAMLAKAQEIAHMGSWEWDIPTGQLSWSEEIFRIFGTAPGSFEPTYEAFLNLLHPEDLERVVNAVQQAVEGRTGYNIEHRIRRPDGEHRYVHEQGEVVRDEQGKPLRMVGTVHDITERKKAQETIEFMENFDPLTGLPNRTLLRYRLEQAVSRAHRERRLVGVLFLGLDRFKAVNDTFGHAGGDHVLRIAADRLSAAVREGDTVARIGGDEFAVLLDGVEAINAITTEVQALNHVLGLALELEGTELFASASTGIAVYPHDGRDPDLLLRNADAALHRAKETGPGGYQFFAEDMTAGSVARMQLERDLRRAIERDEFELYYQPQIRVATGEVVGVEALLRWNHPERGMVSPGTFIPVLEQTGMILPVGQWTLEAACHQNSAWQRAGLPPVRVAVNLSALQFRQTALSEQVAQVLAVTGLPAEYLELEITEGLLVENVDQAVSTLNALYRMGVQVSIDDFGTGYSSMSYLQQFPVTTLKLDRTFVADVSENNDSAAIARAVIALGHSLRLKVIAEGVETPEQHRFLSGEQCDEVQGFLYGRPMPADALAHWLADHRPAELVRMAGGATN